MDIWCILILCPGTMSGGRVKSILAGLVAIVYGRVFGV